MDGASDRAMSGANTGRGRDDERINKQTNGRGDRSSDRRSISMDGAKDQAMGKDCFNVMLGAYDYAIILLML